MDQRMQNVNAEDKQKPRSSGQEKASRHPFEEARDAFLSSLSTQDRSLYSPCASAADLAEAIKKLDAIAHRKLPLENTLKMIEKFSCLIEPYFKVADIFVSSNPEDTALVWGALRLVLQLASNFVTFFDKLTQLLERLSASFLQYEEILELCSEGVDHLPSRIPKIIGQVYSDLLHIFHTAVRVFTKNDGRLKKTPFVIGDLMWKPFDSRFSDMLHRLENHRKALYEEVHLWHFNTSARGRAKAAADRHLTREEQELDAIDREEAARERALALKERQLMALEREQSAEAREGTRASLSDIRGQLTRLERQRIERDFEKTLEWISPPIFIDAREIAGHLREPQTATWIFEELIYKQWLVEGLQASDDRYKFGSNVIWIYGNPGAGKTVLAASIIDSLENQGISQANCKNEVYYYFFEYNSNANNSPSAAYRSILAQVISKHRDDTELLDKFAFPRNGRYRGQLAASGLVLVDLLRLCLTRNSILVLDGIDECSDSDNFISSLLEIWKTSRFRILILSRINVAGLRRAIPENNHMGISTAVISPDIRRFCNSKLQHLFEESILPEYALAQKDNMVNSLVCGADGMFLWAKLMINFLRSPAMTPMQRLGVITQINTPEGLEKMYERIILFIKGSGKRCETLAAKVMTLLIYAPAPISSRQIRQALIVDELFPAETNSESIAEFEDTAIMACAGLVERVTLSHCSSFLLGESSLRVIHLSATETLTENHSTPSMLWQAHWQAPLNPWPSLTPKLIPDRAGANLEIVNCCIRQLLFHTPAQPLSGSLHKSISAHCLYANFCFTDYSAVFWLAHFRNCIDTATTGYRNYLPHFLNLLSNFASLLLTWLRSPRALSVWLEAFYTTENTVAYEHPPGHVLDTFAAWARNASRVDRNFPICDDLINSLESFNAELVEVVRTWGHRLREIPSIIWDEMTAFVEGHRFFFSSGSTRVSYQRSLPPSHLDATQKPVVQVSKTSELGDMKGVLSIWAPPLYHDSNYKKTACKTQDLDLNDICSGWIATYEVFEIHLESALAARVQISIDPKEMLVPIHAYLYHQFSTQIDLPLAISTDVTSFTILETLFVLKQPINGAYCLSCPFLVRSALEMSFSWCRPSGGYAPPDTYSVYFCHNSRILALLEWRRSGEQHLSVFEQALGPELALDAVGILDFNSGMRKIDEVLFHPRQPLLAFCAYSKFDTDWKNAAFIWQYKKPQSLPLVSKLADHDLYEAMNFSSCSQYLLVRSRIRKNVAVIPIPRPFLEDPASLAPVSNVDALGQPGMSLTALAKGKKVMEAPRSGLLSSNQSWEVSPQGGIRSLTIDASANEIHLSQCSSSGTQTTKLVSLPTWTGADQTTQRVFLPRFTGDALKISVDLDPRCGYSHSDYPLAASGIVPTVIERDPRFIQLPTPMISLPVRPVDNARCLLPRGEGGQKRVFAETGLDDESDRIRTIRPEDLGLRDSGSQY